MNETNMNLAYKISFHCIKMVHDGILIRSMVEPDRVLAELGLKDGDTVFEPGCGPGFFTLGAARLVGDGGWVYAYDVNPYAIRYLQKKLKNKGLQNVTAKERNAADTEMSKQSVDFIFITGIPRAVGGFDKLMDEVSRLLKPSGTFAYRVHGNGQKGFSDEELRKWQLVRVQEKDCNRFKVFYKEKFE